MDITSFITIIIAVAIIYLLIKFIVSPAVKVISGIIIFLIIISLLQRFFGFNFSQILAPFGISLNLNNWGLNLNWILGPANYYIDQVKNFLNFIWENFFKSIKL